MWGRCAAIRCGGRGSSPATPPRCRDRSPRRGAPGREPPRDARTRAGARRRRHRAGGGADVQCRPSERHVPGEHERHPDHSGRDAVDPHLHVHRSHRAGERGLRRGLRGRRRAHRDDQIQPGVAAPWTASNTQPGVTARTSKPAADLAWATAAGGPFTALSVTPATAASGAATAGAPRSFFFRTSYSWGLDTPGAYSLAVVFTLLAP